MAVSIPSGLDPPPELLREAAIRAAVAAQRAPSLRRVEVPFEVDSTNSRLLAAEPPPRGMADVMLCEVQLAGRGRRGRRWLAPFGAGVALSLGWSFMAATLVTPALSLCVGVAVARALERAGARGIGLKWPNDLGYNDAKLGGILIDLRAAADGSSHGVIGVGLNVNLTQAARASIESLGVRAAAVADACAERPSRNLIAGTIIDELLRMLVEYERTGFGAFRDAWAALDGLRDRAVDVLVADSVVSGIARGVDADGALQLERAGRLERFMAGDVSLRVA
jgi:BirA family biotin operon repressor/biotin-[acetyl-CoA-carboxylase] ligase